MTSQYDRILAYANKQSIPLWSIIERVGRSEYDGPIPDTAKSPDDDTQQVDERDRGDTKEVKERRFRVVTKPDGTRYVERHVGSLRGIVGKIQIFDSHREAMEEMG